MYKIGRSLLSRRGGREQTGRSASQDPPQTLEAGMKFLPKLVATLWQRARVLYRTATCFSLSCDQIAYLPRHGDSSSGTGATYCIQSEGRWVCLGGWFRLKRAPFAGRFRPSCISWSDRRVSVNGKGEGVQVSSHIVARTRAIIHSYTHTHTHTRTHLSLIHI